MPLFSYSSYVSLVFVLLTRLKEELFETINSPWFPEEGGIDMLRTRLMRVDSKPY
jgi:hypothetical protein